MPMSIEPLPEAFLHLGAVLLGEQSLDEVLQHVVELAGQALPAVSEASISLSRNGSAFTSNATGETALRADQAQYDTDGPCMAAIRTADRHLVRVPEETAQWPEFSAAVAEAGLHWVLSTPLRASEETIGALNLYSRVPDGFDDAQQALAVEFARHASILLANAIAFMRTTELAAGLAEALHSREIIGVATGLLMVQPPRSRQSAFDVLRRASQRENRKLRDIASELVAQAEERAVR